MGSCSKLIAWVQFIFRTLCIGVDEDVKVGLKEEEGEGADWIERTRNRAQWRTLVSTVTNLPIP
jgi:hypothetical protein